jgi:hypothetical protein
MMQRRKVRAQVTLQALTAAGEAITISNLSSSGCRVENAPKEFQSGQQADLTVQLPDFPRPLSLHGIVRWRLNGQAGIQFLNVAPLETAALAACVGRNLKNSTNPKTDMAAELPGSIPVAFSDTDLERIQAAWPNLPTRARRTIMAVIEVCEVLDTAAAPVG